MVVPLAVRLSHGVRQSLLGHLLDAGVHGQHDVLAGARLALCHYPVDPPSRIDLEAPVALLTLKDPVVLGLDPRLADSVTELVVGLLVRLQLSRGVLELLLGYLARVPQHVGRQDALAILADRGGLDLHVGELRSVLRQVAHGVHGDVQPQDARLQALLPGALQARHDLGHGHVDQHGDPCEQRRAVLPGEQAWSRCHGDDRAIGDKRPALGVQDPSTGRVDRDLTDPVLVRLGREGSASKDLHAPQRHEQNAHQHHHDEAKSPETALELLAEGGHRLFPTAGARPAARIASPAGRATTLTPGGGRTSRSGLAAGPG